MNRSTILESTWQGVNFRTRIEDEDVVLGYFDWIKNWKSCPTETVNEFFLLFYQLLPTKCYKLIRSKENLDNTFCRFCRKSEESIRHLMSNCGVLVTSAYTVRHNEALKCFVFPLLKQLKLIDEVPPWWSKSKVKPYYENKDARFWWDVPEFYGTENEDETKSSRPDGKIELLNEKKFFLVEMTVPWFTNRAEKYAFKENKYRNIQQKLKFENPEYEVDQITTVMDSFGGFDKSLKENIEKIITDKHVTRTIVTNMQKSVISSAANLSRRCKINFM